MSMFRSGAPEIPVAPVVDASEAAVDPAAVSLLDDPQEWLGFGRPCTPSGSALDASAVADPASSTWDSHVVLDGMHCAACALTIEDALKSVPGVLQADVSAATRRARVVWQPGRVLPSQWMAAVRSAGYRAVPALSLIHI